MSDDAPGTGEPIEIHSCDDVLSHVFEFLDHETDDARRARDRRAPRGLLLVPARVRHRAGVQGAGPPPLRRRRPAGRPARADQGPADHRLLRGGRHPGQRRADHAPSARLPPSPARGRDRAPYPPIAGAGLCRRPGLGAQALGRLPWLAPFFLRERRLRPRLDIAALLSTCRSGRCTATLVLAGRDAAHVMCAASPGPPS